jgi:hypothetical protein
MSPATFGEHEGATIHGHELVNTGSCLVFIVGGVMVGLAAGCGLAG